MDGDSEKSKEKVKRTERSNKEDRASSDQKRRHNVEHKEDRGKK